MPQDVSTLSIPFPALFEGYCQLLVAHAAAYAIQDLAIEMRGARVDPAALEMVEDAARAAEHRMDAFDAAFPRDLDARIVDVVRSALAGVCR